MQLGEVGGQRHVVELAAVEPGVEPPQRAGVGAAGVRADGGLDQASRGRCRAADIAASSGSIRAGESFMLRALIGNVLCHDFSGCLGPVGATPTGQPGNERSSLWIRCSRRSACLRQSDAAQAACPGQACSEGCRGCGVGSPGERGQALGIPPNGKAVAEGVDLLGMGE